MTLIRFDSFHHDQGLYLDARDITAIVYVDNNAGNTKPDLVGTYVKTYSGSLWHVKGSPRDAVRIIRAANRDDAMGLENSDSDEGDDE